MVAAVVVGVWRGIGALVGVDVNGRADGGAPADRRGTGFLTGLASEYAVLEDADGTVLASMGATERIRPASMTKIMTALVAIETLGDLDASVTVTNDDFAGLYEGGATMAGFQPGEGTTVRDLLYGALLPSGAECCQALAVKAAGSVDAFVGLMNDRARELGMVDTHFSNVTGLDGADHYSTVADIATLLWIALDNEAFREVFASERHVMAPTNIHPDGFTVHSSMFSKLDSAEMPHGRIVGGKTGYTEGAGLCLASAAQIGGEEYILVTVHALATSYLDDANVEDAVRVYARLGEAAE